MAANFQEVAAQLVSAGVNWTELKVEGTGVTADGTKKVTIAIEVEEVEDADKGA